MAKKAITVTSSKGFGWSFGDYGLMDVTLRTKRGFGWNVDAESIPLESVVTHDGEPVSHNGELVTHGA